MGNPWNFVLALFADPNFSPSIWFMLLFFMYVMYKMYQRQLDDLQKEIDRLAKDNHEYRRIFVEFVRSKLDSSK